MATSAHSRSRVAVAYLLLSFFCSYHVNHSSRELTRTSTATRTDPTHNTVQRIYYINLAKNVGRRKLMDGWLGNQTIPFFRINATVGGDNPKDCIAGKRWPPKRCPGISGLAKTQADIIRNHNTSGLTIVFEDDFVATKPVDWLVRQALELVPSDWDIIRWDCWGQIPSSFDFVVPHTVFRTVHNASRPCQATNTSRCWFAGGTHAMMWKGSSVKKLERVWMKQPFDDIDVRLTSEGESLNSYCFNIGIGAMEYPEGERTDIPNH